MFSFVRTGLLLTLAALILGGCQMSKDGSRFTRGQQAALAAEGFAQTDRGWEFNVDDRLLFGVDDSALQSDQAASIQRIGARLLAVDIRHAAVEGHADDTGNADHNQRLSERRAVAVANMLVSAGFASPDVTSIGLGERYPVDTNRSAEGRRQNRRVVILITAP